jgi:hypothetical protein
MQRHAVQIDLIGFGHRTGGFRACQGKAPCLATSKGADFGRIKACD